MVSVIESKFKTSLIAKVEALLLAHESLANCFRAQTICPSVNYTHGNANPNLPMTGDSSGYARGATGKNRGGFNDRGPSGGCRSGTSDRGRGRRFANFQCHTANVCHFRSDVKYQPHESLILYNPANLQPVLC